MNLEKIKKILPRRLFDLLQPIYHFIMAYLAAVLYGFPSRKLIIIGITGTAGKTSTVYLLAKTLAAAGYKTGFTSTAVFSDGDKEWLNDKKMTMPGRLFIQKSLSKMVKNNCRYAIIETTSEGIKQFRHRFINYDILIFTSLYPEHIESHGNFENYQAAKGRLFKHLKRCSTKYINDEKRVISVHNNFKKIDLNRVLKTIIVNGDDEKAAYFLNFWSESKLVCSFNENFKLNNLINELNSEAVVRDFMAIKGTHILEHSDGVTCQINNMPIELKLLGGFNAFNAALVYAVALNQGIEEVKIKEGLESVTSLAGKMELIKMGQDFTAIVDYSFEPLALEKLYSTISLLPRNKIIHVLGSAGGGRDKARRPLLGRLAGEKANIVIISNEDPYDEDPQEIINQVAAGAEEVGKIVNKDLFKILNRQEAIEKAIKLAETGDLLLFTGKGAEQHICVAGGKKIPWDEREMVKNVILGRKV